MFHVFILVGTQFDVNVSVPIYHIEDEYAVGGVFMAK